MNASRRVGKAILEDGESLVLYEAARNLECSRCGRRIVSGEVFTRRLNKGGGYRQFVVCADCAPFESRRD